MYLFLTSKSPLKKYKIIFSPLCDGYQKKLFIKLAAEIDLKYPNDG